MNDWLIYPILIVDTLTACVSAYLFVKVWILPQWKMRHTRKDGFYGAVYRFEKGEFKYAVEGFSIDEAAQWFASKALGIVPQAKNIDDRISERLDKAINSNTDRVIEAILRQPKFEKDLQKQVFEKLKHELKSKGMIKKRAEK